MIFMFFALAIAVLFFAGSLILLRLGQDLGLRHRKRSGSEGIGGLATVEGAIFGLMGLLLAFTISGALQRFDDRRQLVIQEATAATTAYDRLSVFGGDDGRRLRASLKEYVRARIDLYRMAHDFLLIQRAEEFSDQQEKKLLELKSQLWEATLAACPQPNYRPACALSLPALNSLFEVARLRAGAAEKHPPHVIYFMLFGLGLGCSLLAGFGMAASAGPSWIHLLLFAGTLSVALYIVTDMEYPRLGLIRIESFDHFLADAYDQMR
jgi:low affinity Fe/Cu permease